MKTVKWRLATFILIAFTLGAYLFAFAQKVEADRQREHTIQAQRIADEQKVKTLEAQNEAVMQRELVLRSRKEAEEQRYNAITAQRELDELRKQLKKCQDN